MATVNISLPDSLKAFVDSEVAEGGYSTTSEYFRTLLRQAQRDKANERLDSLLLEGLDSGEAVEMDTQDWQAIRQTVRDRLSRRNGGV